MSKPSSISTRLRATAAKAAFLLLAAAAVTSTQAQQSSIPALDFCYRPPGGTDACFSTEDQAEAAMRADTPLGDQLERVGEARSLTKEWLYIYFEPSEKKAPESFGSPGYRVAGWTPPALGCVPSSGDGPGAEYCASEQEAITLWIARRAAFLATNNCEYRNNAVVGAFSRPGSLSGAIAQTQNSSGHFGAPAGEPGSRYIDEEWWCPGWGRPEPVKSPTQIIMNLPFVCPLGYVTTNPASDWPIVCRPLQDRRTLVFKLKQPGSCAANANPCYPATGEKQRHETDFEFAGEGFTRSYRSAGRLSQGNLGGKWNHSFGSRIGDPKNKPALFS